MSPKHQPISFFLQPNQSQAHITHFKIYQKPVQGDTQILNLSAPFLQVEGTQLEISQEQKLLGGERIAFSQETGFDYVFCFTNSQQKNELKIDHQASHYHQEKLKKIQNNIEEELNCAICMETITNCLTLSPCLHNFCNDCLTDHLKRSTDCPLCRKRIKSANKNPLLLRIVELALQAVTPIPLDVKEDLILVEKEDNSTEMKDIYIGPYVNGKKGGQGEMTYADGSVYQGIWKNDKREGKGMLILRNDDIYEGIWVQDLMQSPLKIEYKDGRKYIGEVHDLQMHGKGVLTLNNGNRYEGTWIRNLIQPQVSVQYIDGDYYQGEIDSGSLMKTGKGVLIFSNGDQYDGSWLNDNQHGIGTYTWKRINRVYSGNWEFGEFNGKGTMMYNDGSTWTGNWEDNKKQGEGTLTLRSGTVYTGTWADNVLQPKVEVRYADGDKYSGNVDGKSLKKKDFGVLKFANGDEYRGHWKDDNQHGYGKYIWKKKKKTYTGYWKDGEMHGQGKMVYKDGSSHEGKWEHNKRDTLSDVKIGFEETSIFDRIYTIMG